MAVRRKKLPPRVLSATGCDYYSGDIKIDLERLTNRYSPDYTVLFIPASANFDLMNSKVFGGILTEYESHNQLADIVKFENGSRIITVGVEHLDNVLETHKHVSQKLNTRQQPNPVWWRWIIKVPDDVIEEYSRTAKLPSNLVELLRYFNIALVYNSPRDAIECIKCHKLPSIKGFYMDKITHNPSGESDVNNQP